MAGRPYVLAECTWRDVKSTDYQCAVLPWGATEAHNYHLPYATDNLEATYIGSEAARLAWERGARVVVLPAVPFGVNTGQLDIKLDISMNPSTQAAVLRDVVVSLDRQGIGKLVILNSHGGNDFRQMIRELMPQFPNMLLCSVSWYEDRVLNLRDYFSEPGDHAGEMETSMMQIIAPDLMLPLSEAGDGRERPFKVKALREGWAWTQRYWPEATVDTGVGDPSAATAEKGRRYLEDLTAKLADFFVDLAAADIGDLYEK